MSIELLQLFLILTLISLNGFFALAELAILSAKKLRLQDQTIQQLSLNRANRDHTGWSRFWGDRWRNHSNHPRQWIKRTANDRGIC